MSMAGWAVRCLLVFCLFAASCVIPSESDSVEAGQTEQTDSFGSGSDDDEGRQRDDGERDDDPDTDNSDNTDTDTDTDDTDSDDSGTDNTDDSTSGPVEIDEATRDYLLGGLYSVPEAATVCAANRDDAAVYGTYVAPADRGDHFVLCLRNAQELVWPIDVSLIEPNGSPLDSIVVDQTGVLDEGIITVELLTGVTSGAGRYAGMTEQRGEEKIAQIHFHLPHRRTAGAYQASITDGSGSSRSGTIAVDRYCIDAGPDQATGWKPFGFPALAFGYGFRDFWHCWATPGVVGLSVDDAIATIEQWQAVRPLPFDEGSATEYELASMSPHRFDHGRCVTEADQTGVTEQRPAAGEIAYGRSQVTLVVDLICPELPDLNGLALAGEGGDAIRDLVRANLGLGWAPAGYCHLDEARIDGVRYGGGEPRIAIIFVDCQGSLQAGSDQGTDG